MAPSWMRAAPCCLHSLFAAAAVAVTRVAMSSVASAAVVALPPLLGCIQGVSATGTITGTRAPRSTTTRGTITGTTAPGSTTTQPGLSDAGWLMALDSFYTWLDQDHNGCISEEEIERYAKLKMPNGGIIRNEFESYCRDVPILTKNECNLTTWNEPARILASVFASSARKATTQVWGRCLFQRPLQNLQDPCLTSLRFAEIAAEAADTVWFYSSRLYTALDHDGNSCLSVSDVKAATSNTSCATPLINLTSTCHGMQDFRDDSKSGFESAVLELLTPAPNLERHGDVVKDGANLTIPLSIGGGTLVLCIVLCAVACYRRKRRAYEPAEIRKLEVEDIAQTDDVGEAGANDFGESSGTKAETSETHTCTSAAQFASCNWHYILATSDKDHWLVAADELRFGSAGSCTKRGGFGSVRQATLRGVTHVAVKEPLTRFTSAEAAQIVNEARLFRRMRHPNIVLFYGISFLEKQTEGLVPVLVLEWVDGGDFSEFVRSMNPPDTESRHSAMGILLDVTRAMAFLHESKPPILHLDIKPSNVLVERSLPRRGKVTDFGLSRHMGTRKDAAGGIGTFKYMAPEIMEGSANSCLAKPADVFSFGCVMIFAMLGKHSMEFTVSDVVLPILRSEAVPESIQNVIAECLAVDVTVRPDFLELFRRIEDMLDERSDALRSSSRISERLVPVAL